MPGPSCGLSQPVSSAGRRSQVVRQGFAKPLYVGSIPTVASSSRLHQPPEAALLASGRYVRLARGSQARRPGERCSAPVVSCRIPTWVDPGRHHSASLSESITITSPSSGLLSAGSLASVAGSLTSCNLRMSSHLVLALWWARAALTGGSARHRAVSSTPPSSASTTSIIVRPAVGQALDLFGAIRATLPAGIVVRPFEVARGQEVRSPRRWIGEV
jgi:hypothetical protein